MRRKNYYMRTPSKKALKAHFDFLNLGNQDISCKPFVVVDHGMTNSRYRELSTNLTLRLSPEEKANGWFFCCEWDDMLINKNSPEAECCTCILKEPVK